MNNHLNPVFKEILDNQIAKEYLSHEDFITTAKKILDWDGGIGATDQDLIRWKVKGIVKLSGKKESERC